MKLKIKKLHPSAILPSYVHPGDAGMDIFALKKTVLKPRERTAMETGISMEIPDGYVGLVWDKSGIAIREGIRTLGGVIDAGYRGEILIGVINLSDKEYVFEAGHKVAQMLIQKIEIPSIEEVERLSETKRGHGIFGSTGK
jgi:dUTP pyrophosphatase